MHTTTTTTTTIAGTTTTNTTAASSTTETKIIIMKLSGSVDEDFELNQNILGRFRLSTGRNSYISGAAWSIQLKVLGHVDQDAELAKRHYVHVIIITTTTTFTST